MKRAFSILFYIIAVAGLTFADVNVTVPNGGTWYKGNTYTIRWTSTGCSSPNVKINIFKNAITTENFVEQLTGPNFGSKNWAIPESYINGTYYIRVKTDPEEGCIGDSRAFTIISDPGTSRANCFSLILPRNMGDKTNWKYNEEMPIVWGFIDNSTPCDRPQLVNIYLRNETDTSTIMTIRERATGLRYNWRIDPSTGTGRYRIRITTVGETPISTTANPFSISEQTLAFVPMLFSVFDITGEISNEQVENIGANPLYRWKIGFSIRVSQSSSLDLKKKIPVTWKLFKAGGRQIRSNTYMINRLRIGYTHIKAVEIMCGDLVSKEGRPRLEEGGYYVLVEVDPLSSINDVDRSNNTVRWDFSLRR